MFYIRGTCPGPGGLELPRLFFYIQPYAGSQVDSSGPFVLLLSSGPTGRGGPTGCFPWERGSRYNIRSTGLVDNPAFL